MSIRDDNAALIEQFKSGETEPLLSKLRSGVATSPAPTSPSGFEDSTLPADPIWYQVEAAEMDEEFTPEQYDQLDAAMREGAG